MDNPFTPSQIGLYTTGSCMYLSAALNIVFHWRIEYIDSLKDDDFADSWQPGDHTFLHCYNLTPSGQPIDILGVMLEPADSDMVSAGSLEQIKDEMVWGIPSLEIWYYESLLDAVELVRDNYLYFQQFDNVEGGK